jgi:phosphatidylglycerol:prolipoprotein diacylglycerol transferase
MHPVLFEFDTPQWLHGFLPHHIALYSYGFFIALGILASFIFMLPRLKPLGFDADKLSTLYLWAIVAAFVGGKIFFYLEDPLKYMNNPSLMMKSLGGGFVFYGSLLFVIPTLFWWLRKNKIAILPFFDVLAFGGPILHAIGRIGCFMAGCCHGAVCHNVLGVTYTHPKSSAIPLNMPLYPTQLFDVVLNIIILVVLFWLIKRQKFHGQLFLVYIMMYAVGRSIVENFRGDEARGFIFNGWLSHSQAIAIVLLVVCLFLWQKLSKSATIVTTTPTQEAQPEEPQS